MPQTILVPFHLPQPLHLQTKRVDTSSKVGHGSIQTTEHEQGEPVQAAAAAAAAASVLLNKLQVGWHFFLQ